MISAGYEFESILGIVQWFPMPYDADPEDYACRLTVNTGVMWRVKR
jgi:hypothetical protein